MGSSFCGWDNLIFKQPRLEERPEPVALHRLKGLVLSSFVVMLSHGHLLWEYPTCSRQDQRIQGSVVTRLLLVATRTHQLTEVSPLHTAVGRCSREKGHKVGTPGCSQEKDVADHFSLSFSVPDFIRELQLREQQRTPATQLQRFGFVWAPSFPCLASGKWDLAV